MLEAYNKGWNTSQFSYPIQAVRFNNDFTILGLSDEVVVDYSILYKKPIPGRTFLWLATATMYNFMSLPKKSWMKAVMKVGKA